MSKAVELNTHTSSQIISPAIEGSEHNIETYKRFYNYSLGTIANRNKALKDLYRVCETYRNLVEQQSSLLDDRVKSANSLARQVILRHFGRSILNQYDAIRPNTKATKAPQRTETLLWDLLSILGYVVSETKRNSRELITAKHRYLVFVYNCLYYCGLHPDIWLREPKIYKRYNLMLSYFDFKRQLQSECKILLSERSLRTKYLEYYERRKRLKINGRLIDFKSIDKITITSTVLLDDEIPLFASRERFEWSNNFCDESAFIRACTDETDTAVQHPYKKMKRGARVRFKHSGFTYIHQNRIYELRASKNPKFDTTKLIKMCEELNAAASSKSYYSVGMLGRAILDHVPPVFGLKTFNQVTSNYKGSRSFKNQMTHLQESLRNIADGALHTQIRDSEILPNEVQVDFSNDLDVLLAEILRIIQPIRDA
jgi:hypothetical protein